MFEADSTPQAALYVKLIDELDVSIHNVRLITSRESCLSIS